jgi:hypothetical protein
MGRYYDGDIEGKFWFGVQSSDDAEFFGAKARDPMYVEYGVEDIAEVEEGLEQCKKVLGENKQKLDDFFDSLEHGYNDEMIIDWYMKKYKKLINDEVVKNMLEWYARLDLGEKIKKCMVDKGFCEFRAEL